MSPALEPLHGAPRFTVPAGAEAAAPPEERGIGRDGVRLIAATPRHLEHGVFRDLPDVLTAGDLVVINTSATLPAALDVTRGDGTSGLLHVSTVLDDGSWVVEPRASGNQGPARDARAGERMLLPGRLWLVLEEPYPDDVTSPPRLWRATPTPATAPVAYLPRHGRPIRYGYVPDRWPLQYLQNVYADTPGSAEMPSAGRPFTTDLMARLTARGVTFAPLLLHTGVSSQEAHEPPLPERYVVPQSTARLVSCAKAAGHRVIAVGTTAVRALETVTDADGRVHAGEGWTDLVLGPQRPARTVDGLVTGLHPPEASHLLLLSAVVGPDLVARAYRHAVERRYLWHEFGDSMLLSSR